MLTFSKQLKLITSISWQVVVWRSERRNQTHGQSQRKGGPHTSSKNLNQGANVSLIGMEEEDFLF